VARLRAARPEEQLAVRSRGDRDGQAAEAEPEHAGQRVGRAGARDRVRGRQVGAGPAQQRVADRNGAGDTGEAGQAAGESSTVVVHTAPSY
jgi:hypothetical protein